MWTVQEAKAKLSEVLKRAKAGEPQVIGAQDPCIVISMAEYRAARRDGMKSRISASGWSTTRRAVSSLNCRRERMTGQTRSPGLRTSRQKLPGLRSVAARPRPMGRGAGERLCRRQQCRVRNRASTTGGSRVTAVLAAPARISGSARSSFMNWRTALRDWPLAARIEFLTGFIESMKQRFHGRIVAVDVRLAEIAGRLRGSETKRGRSLPILNSFIAATAIIQNGTLVTRNVKHFQGLGIRR